MKPKQGQDPDPLAVVEAAYRLDLAEEPWLAGIMAAARPMLDGGLGLIAFTADTREIPRVKVGMILVDGLPAPHMRSLVERMVAPDLHGATGIPCSPAATMSQDQPGEPYRIFCETVGMFGMKDAIFLNALDPEGFGCVVAAGLPAPRSLDRRTRTSWSRLAVHIATAHRLRRRLLQLGRTEPEAVVTSDGIVTPASQDARSDRETLRRAALAQVRVRDQLRNESPERALAEWRGLIAAKWTLVDQFDHSGNRYLVARRNEADVAGLDMLSPRERQAVAHACLGHSNKLIAYELGLSTSTIGVLLHRATAKLGVRSRKELIERAKRAMDGNAE